MSMGIHIANLGVASLKAGLTNVVSVGGRSDVGVGITIAVGSLGNGASLVLVGITYP